jgi:FkbH-like protein
MNAGDLDRLSAALARVTASPTAAAYAAAAHAVDALPAEQSLLTPINVAVLRNFTIEPLLPILKTEWAFAGARAEFSVGAFDAIAPEALDAGGALYRFRPDVIIVAQWLETLAPRLVRGFLELSPEGTRAEVDRVVAGIGDVVAALRRNSKAPILVNNFPLLDGFTLGILDSQSADYQTHTLLRLNEALRQMTAAHAGVYVVDYFRWMARVGTARGWDERYWQIGRAPISREGLVPLGREYGKFFRALRGRTRKCLVLDCDGVLWGGIVGEDGPHGIAIGSTYPGSCYQGLQDEIRNLHRRGVLLALCSKNNEADVVEVLRQHPEMVLKETDFATWQINWDDKATNLRRIAEALNIGIDSLVFLDDSAFECDWVRRELPEVAVVHLDGDPSSFRARLAEPGFFDSLAYSAEDRQRNAMYLDDRQRRDLLSSAASVEEYLESLELAAEIGVPGPAEIPRVAQLTQKTNQFTLTTRRYSEGEVSGLVHAPASDVFYLKLKDKVADLGLIAVAVVRYDGPTAFVESLLMSCRALGRGAEDALLAAIFTAAKARGCDQIIGYHEVTKRNGLVNDFYEKRGFRRRDGIGPPIEWELPLTEAAYLPPRWITVHP